MRGKVRSISYTFDKKSVVRRQVGNYIDVNNGDKTTRITVSRITLLDNRDGNPTHFVYGSNDSREEALWKEIRCDNVEVEYDINDLLS